MRTIRARLTALQSYSHLAFNPAVPFSLSLRHPLRSAIVDRCTARHREPRSIIRAVCHALPCHASDVRKPVRTPSVPSKPASPIPPAGSLPPAQQRKIDFGTPPLPPKSSRAVKPSPAHAPRKERRHTRDSTRLHVDLRHACGRYFEGGGGASRAPLPRWGLGVVVGLLVRPAGEGCGFGGLGNAGRGGVWLGTCFFWGIVYTRSLVEGGG